MGVLGRAVKEMEENPVKRIEYEILNIYMEAFYEKMEADRDE